MSHVILAIDDSQDDTLLFRHACRRAGVKFSLVVCNDGDKAIEYLQRTNSSPEACPPPILLLLDLKMPRKSGLEILSWIRDQERMREVKVAIFSSSQNDLDITNAYSRGADWYFSKPVEFDHLAIFASHLDDYVEQRDAAKLLTSPAYRAPLKKL